MKVKRALISVSDKTGLKEFAEKLVKLGVDILSTGGTARQLSDWGVPVIEVSSYTGFPEMLDGRVKTLHPRVHGGILARRDDPVHMKQLEEHGIDPIDMVVVNLYPFEATIARDNVTLEEAIENIDIGGPTMLRSAAKNYDSVAVLTSVDQYESIAEEMLTNKGELSRETRMGLAADVFARTSEYDAAITEYLDTQRESGSSPDNADLPGVYNIDLEKVVSLRYGENPHQAAAFYRDISSDVKGVADARQYQGKELSYNNIMDLSAALEIAASFDRPAVSIVKHNNPCGAATADNLEKAYIEALDCDRLSAFGSIMGFNREIDGSMAGAILKEADFVECIVAPGFADEALDVFAAKKNLRVLSTSMDPWKDPSEKNIRKVLGGALIQDSDTRKTTADDIKVVTDSGVSDELIGSLLFAWQIVKFVKSNAIVLCRGTATVGIGAGQMSRVDSVMIAVRKAGERAGGAVLASDAFFPKADSIEEAHRAGISAIIQPGGSIRDEEVIEACNKFGIPMVFTGTRHFRH